MESIQAESEPIDEEEDVPPGGIPARNERGERLLLFLGIIDILQSYRLRKKLEHTWKSMIHDGDTVSVHRPSFYAQRFLDFMAKTVFKKIPSSLKHSPSKRKSIAKPTRPLEEIDTPGAASSSGIASIKAVSLSDVTAHITPTSVTSPVSTAAKVTMSSAKTTTTSSEADIAFPAVLKGSQKQRVPPPVPPRGSPKAKRGGGNSQASSLETKGDYPNFSISVSDIPPQTPITSSDDDFCFYGHDFIFKEPIACRIPPSISESSVTITKLAASNLFLDYVEEADSITERSYPGKALIDQANMMAKFNIDKHLDSDDEDTSLTESSSEDRIVIQEVDFTEKAKGGQSKSPSRFIKDVVSHIGEKLSRKSPTNLNSSTEKVTVHNIKSSDLIFAAKSLKKVNTDKPKMLHVPKVNTETKVDKYDSKPGIISGLSKKLNFNQSKKDKDRLQEKKAKPRIEIRSYGMTHGLTKDEVICHKKAKTKIDMFQKHIWNAQTDSDSSRRSSFSSSQDSKRSEKLIDAQVLVKETKKIFEPIEYTHGSLTSIDKKHFSLTTTTVKPVLSKAISGNVHEKIKQFSETPLTKTPDKIPRQKKKGSLKRKSDKRRIMKVKKDIEEVL